MLISGGHISNRSIGFHMWAAFAAIRVDRSQNRHFILVSSESSPKIPATRDDNRNFGFNHNMPKSRSFKHVVTGCEVASLYNEIRFNYFKARFHLDPPNWRNFISLVNQTMVHFPPTLPSAINGLHENVWLFMRLLSFIQIYTDLRYIWEVELPLEIGLKTLQHLGHQFSHSVDDVSLGREEILLSWSGRGVFHRLIRTSHQEICITAQSSLSMHWKPATGRLSFESVYLIHTDESRPQMTGGCWSANSVACVANPPLVGIE